jgi:sugar (pentulose or hexulose) kinase
VFESLCFQLRGQLEILEAVARCSCASLRVLGGGQRNDFWLQLKADVTQRRVEAVAVDEATLYGAALLAGVGAGVFGSIHEAQDAVELPLRPFEPAPASRDRYAELYEGVFRRLPAATADATRALAEVGG